MTHVITAIVALVIGFIVGRLLPRHDGYAAGGEVTEDEWIDAVDKVSRGAHRRG